MGDASEKDIKAIDPGIQRMVEAAKMFEEYRAGIISSLPAGLSDQELKRQLFERIYGAPMEDFRSGKVTDAYIVHQDRP